MRNESDHALQYHLYSSADCMIEGCLPPLQITKTIAPGGMIVDLYTTLPQGRVLSVSDVDALNLSLRAQEFYVGGSIGPEGAFKGPEVPIARGHDFRKSIHIVSVPVHLNTYLRVYSLDSAPTVHVRLFNVEFEREVMLEEFDLALAQPVYDGPFVMLPAWAERDLSAELAALDQRIPQGRIAFRIESPAPIWAMVMQHDPQRHVATFVTQQ